MMPLDLLTPGERAEILEIRHCGGCGGRCHSHGHHHDHSHHHHHNKNNATRAEEMGLRVGKQIEMLKNDGNLLLVLVDEARIALDRRMARSITVKGLTA